MDLAPSFAPLRLYLRDLGMYRDIPEPREPFVIGPYRKTRYVVETLRRLGMIWSGGRFCRECATQTYYVAWEVPRGASDPYLAVTPPAALVRDLGRYARAKVRWVFVYLNWRYDSTDPSRPAGRTGHATMLVFDTQARTYNLFDPNSGDLALGGHWFDRHDVVVENARRFGPLVPGYRAVADRRSGVPSLQTNLERSADAFPTDQRERKLVVYRGLCATVLALVVACCRRFAYFNPWGMAHALSFLLEKEFWRGESMEGFRYQMVHWYQRLYRYSQWDRLERLVGLRPPPGPAANAFERDRRCEVRSERTGRYCQRRPCAGHAYCAQHRHLLLMALWRRTRSRCVDEVPWRRRLGPLVARGAGTVVHEVD